jgi:hypothetical protein
MLGDCWILHTRQAGEQSLSDTDIGLISAGGYREAVARHLPGASAVASPSKPIGGSASSADADGEEPPSTRSHQLFLKMQSSDFSALSDASAPGAAARGGSRCGPSAKIPCPQCSRRLRPIRKTNTA